MRNKLETVRQLVQKLEQRYGLNDEVVMQLKTELLAMESKVHVLTEHRKQYTHPYSFQTAAKQRFYDSSPQTFH